MRKIIIFIALVTSINITYAQSYTEAFDSVFANISKTQATTGILYERVLPFAELQNFNSNVSTVDTSSSEHFIQGYFELYNAAFQQFAKLPFNADSLQTLIEGSVDTVDIGILHYKFNMLDSAVAHQKLNIY